MEYEQKLDGCLVNVSLAYDTEEHLRTKGAYKTPDALLQVRHNIRYSTEYILHDLALIASRLSFVIATPKADPLQ